MLSEEVRADHGGRPQLSLLLGVVLIVYVGQMTLGPIIAPLARDLGLAEWQVGVTISSAALMVVLTSQFWGRRAQSAGFKPVLVSALLAATVTMLLFTVVVSVGLAGVLTGWLLFLLFLLLRGVAFGTAIAAVPPTAQAYVAEVTPEGQQRVKAMAGVGAMQGLASILGAIIGGVLAGLGLLVPIAVVPVLIGAGLAVVLWGLRSGGQGQLVAAPRRISPADPRVWPFLMAGFGMFTALGFIQVTGGFLIQDRLHLASETAGQMTGAMMLVMGLGMVLSQAVIVPRTGWGPPRLLRLGTVVAAIGFILLLPDQGAWLLFLAFALMGLGLGLAIPGYTAGPTMLVQRDEQGGLAGVVGTTNGLTYVISPALSTILYGWWRPLPVVISIAMLIAVVVFLAMHPAFRRFVPLRAEEVR